MKRKNDRAYSTVANKKKPDPERENPIFAFISEFLNDPNQLKDPRFQQQNQDLNFGYIKKQIEAEPRKRRPIGNYSIDYTNENRETANTYTYEYFQDDNSLLRKYKIKIKSTPMGYKSGKGSSDTTIDNQMSRIFYMIDLKHDKEENPLKPSWEKNAHLTVDMFYSENTQGNNGLHPAHYTEQYTDGNTNIIVHAFFKFKDCQCIHIQTQIKAIDQYGKEFQLQDDKKKILEEGIEKRIEPAKSLLKELVDKIQQKQQEQSTKIKSSYESLKDLYELFQLEQDPRIQKKIIDEAKSIDKEIAKYILIANRYNIDSRTYSKENFIKKAIQKMNFILSNREKEKTATEKTVAEKAEKIIAKKAEKTLPQSKGKRSNLPQNSYEDLSKKFTELEETLDSQKKQNTTTTPNTDLKKIDPLIALAKKFKSIITDLTVNLINTDNTLVQDMINKANNNLTNIESMLKTFSINNNPLTKNQTKIIQEIFPDLLVSTNTQPVNDGNTSTSPSTFRPSNQDLASMLDRCSFIPGRKQLLESILPALSKLQNINPQIDDHQTSSESTNSRTPPPITNTSDDTKRGTRPNKEKSNKKP